MSVIDDLVDHAAVLSTVVHSRSFLDPDMASFHEAVCDLARRGPEFPTSGAELERIAANINYQVRRALHLIKHEAAKRSLGETHGHSHP